MRKRAPEATPAYKSTDMGWRSFLRLASLRLGSASGLALHAAASADKSLSLNESAMMSAGVWPRSTAASVSSSDVEGMASRCIRG